MNSYYVDLDVTLDRELSLDEVDDLLEFFNPHGGAIAAGGTSVGVSIGVDALDPVSAITTGRDILARGLPTPIAIWESISAKTEAARQEELMSPMVPDLVGYAEIAEIAGVSRSRARKFDAIADFPKAVMSSTGGPLRVRAAIEAWAAKRDRRPGRRARVDS